MPWRELGGRLNERQSAAGVLKRRLTERSLPLALQRLQIGAKVDLGGIWQIAVRQVGYELMVTCRSITVVEEVDKRTRFGIAEIVRVGILWILPHKLAEDIDEPTTSSYILDQAVIISSIEAVIRFVRGRLSLFEPEGDEPIV